MEIILVAEDEATRQVLKKLIIHLKLNYTSIIEEPVRGGKIKEMAKNYNKLSLPVFMLLDSDSECPPDLIKELFGNEEFNDNFIFSIACDEVESWLMADTDNFAKFFGVDVKFLPGPQQRNNRNEEDIELYFPYKPSLYLMKEIIPHSGSKLIIEQILPRKFAKKGPEYNSVMTSFIINYWNIENAVKKSYSLRKALHRINSFKYKFGK